uniref:lactadherin-like n=1 Tax=Styela clava TaxID=7725 RepID=UPI00193982AE|nr:lactadherin-like [Styela clava]
MRSIWMGTFVFLCLTLSSCFATNDGACMSVMRQLVGGQATRSMGQLAPVGCNNCESRPGKRGPLGPPGDRGPKGLKGDAGACVCDLSEVERLKQQLSRQEEILQRVGRLVKGVCYVGISSGLVPISSITASSTHPDCPLVNIPLNSRISWCALASRSGEWVQVDLQKPRPITGVVTQGRTRYGQYVKSFKVQYGNSVLALRTYQENGSEKIFKANNDMNTPVENRFEEAIEARYIRIYPVNYISHMSMRLELLDC